MVKICDKYPVDNNDFKEYFDYFDFELSDFQKWAIQAIQTGNHCLITAHTGSGKTLPAEFAILYAKSIGKKVIYTGPIKALCNQKLYDFRKKYPHISFGILTGDIKDNPEADVLIMTTEILRNTLFNKSINKNEKKPALSFDMDFETELGAAIIDEAHYIADDDRGSVWEQSIIMLPKQVQLVMLSATIDKPENFAGWVEKLKNNKDKDNDKKVKDKEVYLCSTYERVVPLNHYMWLTCHQDTIKSAKKTQFELLLKKNLNCPVIIATSRDKRFNIENYELMIRLERFIDKCNRVKRPFVLNGLVNYLKNNEMLPALCFVFSRKNVEACAKEINFSLFDSDDTTPNIIENECKQMVMRKLPNYREYINLPEYINLIDLLKKGIAIHHAGIMPVLREIVELLFEKNYIKLLFATETFAVGLNMPTKTVIFTGLSKFNGNGMRDLHAHEYTQMAGRAGRRGLDTIGHVIHCNNLFQCESSNSYKNMLTGGAKLLTSKFKISFNLILNIIYSKSLNNNRDDSNRDDSNNDNKKNLFAEVKKFVGKSMIQETLTREVKYFDKENAKLSMEIYDQQENVIPRLRSTVKVIEQYRDLEIQLENVSQNKKRQIFAKIKKLEDENETLVADLIQYDEYNELIKEKAENLKKKRDVECYIDNNIQNVLDILIDNQFIDVNFIIMDKGIISSQIQEVHSLVLGEIYHETNGFNEYESIDLAIFFSCFTSIRVDDTCKRLNTATHYLNKLFQLTEKIYDKYESQQNQYYIPDDTENNFHRDLIDYVKEWYLAKDEIQCMDIISRVKIELDLFLGDFVKAIIKINNISMEIDKICEIMGNVELRHKISKISVNILKYVATNQSLYV